MVKVLAVLYRGGKAAKEEPRLLGTVENELGLRPFLENTGHTFVVTDDKEGPNSEFRKQVKDADILITTPFHPAYVTREVLDEAKNLKLSVTAGVGSDHVDLQAAIDKKITVAEVSGSNVVSVAEHVVMTILILTRNFVPAHEQIESGGWEVAPIARAAFDLEGKVVGTIGAGRIGQRVLARLQPFNLKEALYYDYQALPPDVENALGARRVDGVDALLKQCDVVTINCPLHEKTRHLINKQSIQNIKQGAWIVNTARGAICEREAIKEALSTGKISGYGGDVWDYQPAPKDHPWRTMKNTLGGGNAMVPHYSGTTIDAQQRYATGTKEIIEAFLSKQPIKQEYLIVTDGQFATKAYGQNDKAYAKGS